MESTLKELMDQASCRLMELKSLHEERIKILLQLSSLRNTLKNVKCISSSNAYLLVKDQIEKSKSEFLQYQALYEKLQAEKDSLLWSERELSIKNDMVDVFRRSSTIDDSRATDLRVEIQKQIEERNRLESKLEEASREPGRKEIIAEFRNLVSSFPEEMSTMQSELSKYKEAASDVHSLRADVQSVSGILERKVKEFETLSARSADQVAEMKKLQAVVQDLKESDLELKLILEMYRRESTDSRDVIEAKDLEYKAWAHVQTLKSSLDEHNLELRVKTANEAEAISQQRLAAAEADIAELRQKLEASKRDISRLTDVLKSKNEENEAYLSEIESIGQAYDDMQNQNQHLLQQITERDDYNIKVIVYLRLFFYLR
ncbi:E3 ubiquitin-protein ligase BRE1-like 1 isoform X1 [Quercus suber]|uniref:E3 ubiquitin-protein ligase BRE1-like 1 isoform X1 n=2 Tax=Quercus suber TaxID=58331 RepID=UPI0032DEF680